MGIDLFLFIKVSVPGLPTKNFSDLLVLDAKNWFLFWYWCLRFFPHYEQTPTTESSVCSLKVRFAVTHQMTAIFTPNISFSSAVIFLLFPHFYKMAKKWSMQMTLQRQVTAMPKPSCCLLSPHVFPLYHAELGGLNKWIPNEQKCRICGKGM